MAFYILEVAVCLVVIFCFTQLSTKAKDVEDAYKQGFEEGSKAFGELIKQAVEKNSRKNQTP